MYSDACEMWSVQMYAWWERVSCPIRRPALDCADLNSDSTIPESQDEPFLLLERVGGRGGTSTKVQDQDQAAGGRQGRLCGPLGR